MLTLLLLLIPIILYPVFTQAKGPSFTKYRARMARDLRIQEEARKEARDSEVAGNPDRAEKILQAAFDRHKNRYGDERTGEALLDLLIRRGKWPEAAKHADGLGLGVVGPLGQFDLDVAARRPHPKKFRACWREMFTITKDLESARLGGDPLLVKRLERRLALFPIAPAVARVELQREVPRVESPGDRQKD